MRFVLSSIGRLVHPFSTPVKPAGPAGVAQTLQPTPIEQLHVERAHAVVHPVHLPTVDGRRRASFVNTVRDIRARTS